MDYYNMWYVDGDEVEAIWNQTSNTVEVTNSKEYIRTFWTSLKAGLSKWKLVSVEGNGKFNVSQNISVIERENFSIQRKILDIKERLGEKACPLQSQLKKEKNTCLLCVEGNFVLQEIYYKGKPEKNILGKISHIEKAEDLVWHMKFVSAKGENVHLYADGKKIVTHIRHLTKRIDYRTPFYFTIIGWLEYVTEGEYCIKPVVIMR